MEGSKAIYLENWALKNNRPFIRFDYSGHGESSEKFIDGCVGDWKQDSLELINALTKEPQILIGSSMGGWISLLLCREIPANVCVLNFAFCRSAPVHLSHKRLVSAPKENH